MRCTVLFLIVAATLAGCGEKSEKNTSPFEGVEQHGTFLGDQKAPYTLVEFADLQCPFCGAFSRDTLPAVVDEFVRPGRLRLELRPISFLGADSSTGAAATVAAGLQDHMWDYASAFYEKQGPENSGYVTPRFIGEIAQSIPGLDFKRFQAASGTEGLVAELRAHARAAKTAGVTKTPAFRLGRAGEPLTPFEPKSLKRDEFVDQLRAALSPG